MASRLTAVLPEEAGADAPAPASAPLPPIGLLLEDALAQSPQRQETVRCVAEDDPYLIASALCFAAPCAHHLALASYALYKGGHAFVALDVVGRWYTGLVSALRFEWELWVLADGVARALVAAQPALPVTPAVCYLCIALLQRLPTHDPQRLRFLENALTQYMATRAVSPHASALASTLAALLYARVRVPAPLALPCAAPRLVCAGATLALPAASVCCQR